MPERVIRLTESGEGAAGFNPSNFVPPEAFTSADRTELDCPIHSNPEVGISVGVWECAPCALDIESFPVNEFMTVADGSLRVISADGADDTFTAGSSFFVPNGATAHREITDKQRVFDIRPA